MGRGRLVALLAALLAVPALAQGIEEVALYEGSVGKGLLLGSWGSGSVKEVDEVKYEGHSVLSVYTEGLYSGGRLEWSPPKDVRGLLADKFGYLRLAVLVPRRAAAPGVPGMPGGPEMPVFPGMPGVEGMPPFWGQMMQGRGAPGMPPWAVPGGEGGGPGMPGVPGAPGVERKPPREISAVRLLIQTDGGWLALPPMDLDFSKAGPTGWLELNIPLGKFVKVGKVGPESKLRRLLIFGDAEGKIYIGRIALARDDSPIKLTALASAGGRTSTEIDCLAGDTVAFTAEADGGLATIEVYWDFDARDGIKREATGLRVEHTFEKPGDYTVTAVAVDVDGVKAEARSTIKVHVHPAE